MTDKEKLKTIMKYKIQFILDKQIPTDLIRDIKLTLLNNEVDMSLISDYPIHIPDGFIYLSDIKFSILKKEVKITNGFFTTEITILDNETRENQGYKRILF
jgi:hypothetical protein